MRAIAGPDMVVLRSTEEHRGENLQTFSEFTIKKGETATFVITYGPSYEDPPETIDAEQALRETVSYWQGWTARANLIGEYDDAIERSLVTLKALTYQHTGGIVGAPTTSLPERLGGERNWDYRYCWLRDATSSLLALMNAGYFEEACAWRDWFLRAAAGSPDQVQIMYGIRGERHLIKWEVNWLGGYEDSRPVRMGNAAFSQLQLDVYGEVADALLEAHPKKGFLAVSRTINPLFPMHDFPERGFPDWLLGSFTQNPGSKELDASLLLIPLVGFLPVSDSRVQAQ